MTTIYIIAGEPSGDLLGAHLMRALKEQSTTPIKFYGVGGERMIAEGMTSLFPYYELAMMGFLEILPYLFNLMARISRTVEDAAAKNPNMVITIDSPGFCFRVVDKLREGNLPATFVHYVAPSVWAYKPERAQKCARLFDHLLALLPFEPPYFERVGLKTTFVGHPVVGETQVGSGDAFRAKYNIEKDRPVFCLMPGSRKGEIKRHMPIFAKTITMLATLYPNLVIVVPVPRHVMQFIEPYFKNCPFRAIATSEEEDRKNAVAAADVAIVKSGTVTLEVAMAGTPMIVTYRVNPVSAWLFRRIRLIRFANLVNIIEDEEIIPELLQECCTPIMLATAASRLLSDENARQNQKNHSRAALAKLLPEGHHLPSYVAARAVLRLFSPKNN